MSNARKELYEFDKFRLEVAERILWRGGERVALSEKAFDTLVALVRRGNHLVGKDELLTEIWAGAFVEENNLDKNISILRRALGERDGKGKFIETVRGHGFRFAVPIKDSNSADQTVAPIEPEPEISESSDESEAELAEVKDLELEAETDVLKPGNEVSIQTPTLKTAEIRNPKSKIRNRAVFVVLILLISAGAATVYFWRSRSDAASTMSSPPKTIAVLPFKSLGAEKRNEALELGMADSLIAKLGSGEIIVRPLGSVSRFAALEQDSLAAGRELGVETVLDGTIQTADNRIRISAQLFRTEDGKQLWTGQFDEKFTDIFAVQDAISERVATALKIRLTGNGKKHHTENVEAYEFYMKGRFYLLKGTRSETGTSVSYFQQAVAADPDYALAYSGLADAYRGQTVGGEMPAIEIMPKAKAAALRAIEIDDRLAEGHAILGHIYYWYEWDWKTAEREHQRSLELNPNSTDALQFYAHLLSSMGRHTEALAKMKRARELDPLDLRVNAVEGMLLLNAGQTDESIVRLQKTLELNPNHRLSNMFAARAYTEKGMFAEAEAATQKAWKISPDSSEPAAYGSYALARSGKRAEAQAALDELLRSSETRYIPPYHLALIYNALGESGKALDYLEKAFAEKDVRMVWLKIEPKWNNLRNEPRFIDLMRRMNFE